MLAVASLPPYMRPPGRTVTHPGLGPDPFTGTTLTSRTVTEGRREGLDLPVEQVDRDGGGAELGQDEAEVAVEQAEAGDHQVVGQHQGLRGHDDRADEEREQQPAPAGGS